MAEKTTADGAAETAARTGGARRTTLVGNLIRGALIGTVETIPGVSGGTVALVVGIYHQLISSASHVITAFRRLITGPDRTASFRENMAAVHVKVVVPVLLGMVVAVFSVAGTVADVVGTYPVLTRAAFFGMVLASVAVPARMVRADLRSTGRRLSKGHVLAGALACVLTFVLVSLPPISVQAHPLVILPAAMVAVSALVLPGLSGSFLLLTFGLYEPTLRAVEARDLGYLGIFMAGMTLGLIVIVKVLTWLLQHRHAITLVVLTGVMVGALRTLWPWQTEGRTVQAPDERWAMALGLGALGFALVAVLVIVDARFAARSSR